jgi:hypothetical protein
MDNHTPPWPTVEDSLFLAADHWTGATIGTRWQSWPEYAHGYHGAAQVLIEHIKADRRQLDYLAFPIFFLYRHSFEAYLKHIIWVGRQLDGDSSEKPVPGHHNLVKLWDEARRLIERHWGPDGTRAEDLDGAGSILGQFEERDPTATAFRYPVKKDGVPSHQELRQYSLSHFAEVASGLIDLLEVTSATFDDWLEERRP